MLTHSYFAFSISLTNSQNIHQCLHAYDQQQEIPTRPLQKPPLLLIMTKNKQVSILIILHKVIHLKQ
jgi:ADP-glucose pyrophosphorylase